MINLRKLKAIAAIAAVACTLAVSAATEAPAMASVAQPVAVQAIHPHVTGDGGPIKEASGSFCIRDSSGGDPGGQNAIIKEGTCGSGPGENLRWVTTGSTFEGFATGEFHFTGELTPDTCLGINTSNWFQAIPQFCSGVNGVVFIQKPLNGAFQIVSRPGTQHQGQDLMLTGQNSANSAFLFGTAGAGFQRFVNF